MLNEIPLRTQVVFPTPANDARVSYCHALLSLGSCFSDRIGQKLYNLGYNINVNPFGTLYNPISIAQALHYLNNDALSFAEDLLVSTPRGFCSLMHHSKYVDEDADALLQRLNHNLDEARKQLAHSSHLLITFGAAHCYRLRSSGCVVANCHKLPSSQFELLLPSVEELFHALLPQFESLIERYPSLKIVCTVSPIRYMGYGAHQSALSKARLLLLVELLQQRFSHHVLYFPAYEFVLDELRDYRFYADDMLHPSALCEELVFQKFLSIYGAPSEANERAAAYKLQKLALHRPLPGNENLHLSHIKAHAQRLRDRYAAPIQLQQIAPQLLNDTLL